MTDQPRYIAKPPVLKPAEDFYRLRQEGISFIEEMGTELWTDYNAHDPGITILEALCYGITELAYRTGWDIKDILTPDPAKKKAVSAADQPYPGQYFPSAREILTVNPVTTDDFRRLLIDHKDVRNAWVTEVIDNKEKNGLYDVLIEPEIAPKDKTQKDAIIKNVREELNKHRNLCEDFREIELIETEKTEKIVVCAEIDLRPDADINSVYEHILLEIENYLNPPIPFQTLDELVEKKEKIEAIFNGPQVENGFIQAEELKSASLREDVYLSDIINILIPTEGVVAIRCLRLINGNDGNNKWKKHIDSKKKPSIDIAASNFIFYKNGLPFSLHEKDEEKLKRLEGRLSQLRKETERGKTEFSEKQDIPIPKGTFRNLNEYFPVQYSLPTAYGIGPDGLAAQASDERRARAKQLQGYLMPFEQILANAFSQLEHVGDLFSLDQKENHSYAVKEFNNEIISGIEEIFNSINEFPDSGGESGHDIDCMAQCPIKEKCEAIGAEDCINFWYEEASQECNAAVSYARKTIDEILPKYNQQERRNRFLDHLLARFGERFDDYRIVNQVEEKTSVKDKTTPIKDLIEDKKIIIKELIEDKISFIKIQRETSSDRAKAFDYTENNGNYLKLEGQNKVIIKNIPEIKKRVNLLLGCPELVFSWKDNVFELINDGRKDDSLYLSGKFLNDTGDITDKSFEIINNISEAHLRDKKYKIEIKGIQLLSLQEETIDELSRWSIFQRAIVVEHILLRPHDSENVDPYSFRLTFVIPGWHGLNNSDQTSRESFITMRNFTERIIRQEMPAHLFVNILWVDKDSFTEFEKIWYNWLKAKTQAECSDISICRSAVLDKLCMLKNIYPYAGLNNSVCLGKTTLGSSEKRPKRLGEIVLKSDGRPEHLGEGSLGKIVLENTGRPSRLGEIALDNSTLNKGDLK